MNLAAAERLAERVRRLLAPACAEVMVVGSVRRRRPVVGDIELACIPRAAVAVFGEPLGARNGLEQHLANLLRRGELRPCPEPSRRLNGPRQKRYWVPDAGGVEVELWIADVSGANFGNVCVIRTGDVDFAHLLVAPQAATVQLRAGGTGRGLMPPGRRHEDGRLWDGDRRLDARTEAAFFGHLGIGPGDIPPPERRDEAAARRLRALLARERAGA